MADKKKFEEMCEHFGEIDGSNGACHYCKEEIPDLFAACWRKRFCNSVKKTVRKVIFNESK